MNPVLQNAFVIWPVVLIALSLVPVLLGLRAYRRSR
jgi:hypothetical protein